MFVKLLFVVILVLDQITKYAAIAHLSSGSVRVIPGLFDLTLVYNPGAAFGLFAGLPDVPRRIALATVSALALFVVVKLIFKDAKDDRYSQMALAGILAGAIGNIIDRLRYDAVVDFLDFYWGTYHWPAFNVADSAICVGVTLLAIRMLWFSAPSVEKSQVPA